jgi:uncharacterized protein YndB with AHSA1/START domain
MEISIQALISAPKEKVWGCWTDPQHITQWNAASDDWHCPKASNDLQVGGLFSSTMAAKDGSFSFDFGGSHKTVEHLHLIVSELEDGRNMSVKFTVKGNQTLVEETFDTESENDPEMQRAGWQAILNNFKAHVESLG